MAAHTAALDEYGPERSRTCTPAEAAAWCRRLTVGRQENFSVLSALVPPGLVGDFSAVYAFCRVADDLGDESPSREMALERLQWWRSELESCGLGEARHPVFVALRPVLATLAEVPTQEGQPTPELGVDDETGQGFYGGLASDPVVYYLAASQTRGDVFANDAQAEIVNGEWVVTVSLTDGEGTAEWNRLASECFYRQETCPTGQLAIVMDGVVQSAPALQEPNFDGGSVQITGAFAESDARDLARILQFGSVNIAFDTPEVNTVSASLGEESVRAVVLSGIVGLALVSLLLFVYYGLAAALAVAGLLVTAGILWSVICLISGTSGLALSLAGCAGVIVSVGLSVDSYVVLFERIKDDIVAGRTLRTSARRALESSWKTILIANTTSLIGAGILWWLTVGTVPTDLMVALINMDMVSRSDDGAIRVDGGDVGAPVTAALVKLAPQASLPLVVDTHPEWLPRSDQGPFLAKGVPSVLLSVEDHADYHTVDDEVERIDADLAARTARLVCRTIEQLAVPGAFAPR